MGESSGKPRTDFAEHDFLPFARSTFAAKPKTLAYYENGVSRLLAFKRLAGARLDAITSDRVAEFVTERQGAKGKRGAMLQVASLNRELQVLRRTFHLAEEWGRVERTLPNAKMLPGEKHRERVLTAAEEDLYFRGASTDTMAQYADAGLLRDVATVLLDCGLRPEECFRLRTENVTDGNIEIHYGKTDNARRQIPMTARVKATLDMRLSKANSSPWVFPAQTKSGHIEPSTLKKQHLRAIAEGTRILREDTGKEDARLERFELYTLRHTCLTRWAPHMDPWTLAYLAGHRDMNITKRYVHPQEQTIRAAMERVQQEKGGHTSGHTGQQTALEAMPVLTPNI
ncbi:MAG TPA: tyrosine-type recombinase/integrase [Bryobacteraceae bacterium]|nr:tyrosine-type recombinase/integrase [Bryobacteraceae bacterium]